MQILISQGYKTGRRFLYLLLSIASLAFLNHPAQAQYDEQPLDEITVTGSLIKREESSQLVTEISSEDIAMRGATSAVEILDSITTGQAPLLTSNVAAAFNPGFTNFANLRSLGPSSTLILLDGRRIVREPFSGRAVNLNVVPTAMLSSVDVLSDGASSIYGSDAIAGVINFRTFAEIEGLQYYLHSMNPVESGAEQRKASLAVGFGSLEEDGYNVYVGGTWRDRDPLRGPERDYLSEAPRADKGQNPIPGRLEAEPGNVRQTSAGIGGNGLNPYPECNPPTQLSNGAGACYLSLLGRNFITLSGEDQQSLVTNVTAKVFDDHVFTAQYFHSWSEIFNQFGAGRRSEVIPVASPYYPGGGTIPAIPGQDLTADVMTQNAQIGYRKERTNKINDWANRFLASLEGDFGNTNYELWAMHSESETEIANQLYDISINDGVPGLNGAPFINPFVGFDEQTPEAQAFIESTDLGVVTNRFGQSELTSAGLTISGDAFSLAAGSALYAVAVEYQDESIFLEELPVRLLAGQSVAAYENGQRDVWSLTGELLIPVTDSFEINASVRYDDYSDAGDTTNPKLLLSWDVSDVVNLHASFNTGFRAPTLYDVFRQRSFGFTSENPIQADPERCDTSVDPFVPLFPAEDDFFDVCRGQYSTLRGGNANLEPEESTAFVVGVDLRFPVGNGQLGIRLDYWDYEVDNVIGPIDVIAIFEDLDKFGGLIIRCNDLDPADLDLTLTCEDDPNGPNRIGAIEQFLQNLGTIRTSGYDVKLSWDSQVGNGLDLGISFNATIVDEYVQQRYAGDGLNSRAGTFLGTQGPVFEYQHYLAATLGKDKWRVRLQHRYKDSYKDCNAACGIAEEFFNTVDAYGLVDLSGTYRFSDNLGVTLHVLNVFDEDPPFTNNSRQGAALSGNTDVRYTDPRGQSIGLTLTGEF